jgi:hypothetical protein
MTVFLRSILVGLAAFVLVSCTVDANKSDVRVVELIDGLGAIDLYIEDDEDDSVTKFTDGGGFETVGPATGTPDGDQVLSFRSAGGTSNVISQTVNLETGDQTDLVLAGSSSNPRLYVIEESADKPSSGEARLQVINTIPSGPSYDVFITTGDAVLAAVSPTVSGTASGATSDSVDFDEGTYRVRITTGASRDLVYDSGSPASVPFESRSVNSLVVYSSSSSLLARAILLTGSDSDSAAASASQLTRIRMVNTAALADPENSLNLRLANETEFIFGGLKASNASNYKSFANPPSTALALEGNDTANTQYGTFNFALQAGEDQTILASGTEPNLSLSLIKDSNTAPRSGYASVRVINGVTGGGDAQVTVKFSNDFSGVAENTGSNYVEYLPAPDYEFGLQLANGTGLVEIATVELEENRVYTMLFYGSASAPEAVLLTDR